MRRARLVLSVLVALAPTTGATPVDTGQRAIVQRGSGGARVFPVIPTETKGMAIVPYRRGDVRPGQTYYLVGYGAGVSARVEAVARSEMCETDVGVTGVEGSFSMAVGPGADGTEWHQKLFPREWLEAAYPDREVVGFAVVKNPDDEPRRGFVALQGTCAQPGPSVLCIREVAVEPGGALRVLAETELVCHDV